MIDIIAFVQKFETANSNKSPVDDIIMNLIKLVTGIGINLNVEGSNNTDVKMRDFDERLEAFINIIDKYDFYNKHPYFKCIFERKDKSKSIIE